MTDPLRLTEQELRRQCASHLESLRAAGVDWLPAASPGARSASSQCSPPPVLDAEPHAPPDASASGSNARPGQQLFADRDSEGPTIWTVQARKALEVLAEQVSTCHRCPELVATRTRTVFGVGAPGAQLCFVGEAPGADEDAQGEPFVGAAGQLLNRILAACRMAREEVYICNIIKCRPPRNRTPLPHEVGNCRTYLEEQLALVRPRFICALGGCAAQNLLATTASLGQLRGRFHDYRGIPVMVTYHPAYLLPHRNPGKKKEVWQDMKMLMARMGRAVE